MINPSAFILIIGVFILWGFWDLLMFCSGIIFGWIWDANWGEEE